MHVLIVEDSKANRLMLHQTLVRFRFKVTDTESAAAAIWQIEKGIAFDLMIVDYQMERMTGIELVRRIRAMPNFVHTPILMISGERLSMNLLEEALGAGITDFLAKPFGIEVLEEKLLSMGIEPEPDPGPSKAPGKG